MPFGTALNRHSAPVRSHRLIPSTPPFTGELFWPITPAAAIGDTDVCWRWGGSYWHGDTESYGDFHGFVASRVAYFLDTGNQPGKLEVCHTCDHPWCVNPTHLFVGTHRDNALDCMAKGRHRHGTTPKGQKTQKINEIIVRDIRDSGDTIPTLMARHGLSEGWIHKIKSRRAWKHVV